MHKSDEKLVTISLRITEQMDRELNDLISAKRWVKSDFVRSAIQARLNQEKEKGLVKPLFPAKLPISP